VPARRPLAVVTGASTGIGAALADELARRGHDLLLVALPGEGLPERARTLVADHGVAAEALECDLTDRAGLERVAARLREQDVDVLCNNAGVGDFGPFLRTFSAEQIELDVYAPAVLTAAALPGMLGRRSGAILMVGSTAGNQPIPNGATYAACKAFVNSLSESLHAELAGTGVRCTLLAPGPVHTAFADRAGLGRAAARIPEPVWVSAERAARAGLDGLARGRRRVTPGVPGHLIDIGGRLAPRSVLSPVLRRVIAAGVRGRRA
jgi:short-subunit dehydrogenase